MGGVRLAWLSVLVAAFGLMLAPPAQAVSWPASSGLLVSEVVTGGASASDEFVEIYNASSNDLDLGGLELVYVTSTGGTVTRKQTWSVLVLPAHRHVLLANSSGAYAAGADGLYSGGLSATGGSVVLRTLAGVVIDSLSWGDAASSFVEAHSGAAPPAGSSLERKPGRAAGNSTDTNDNLADAAINAAPVAQGLAAAPVPAVAATPSPTQTPSPVSTPSPTPMCAWSPLPAPTLTPSPMATAAVGPQVLVGGQLATATGVIDGGRTAYLDYGTGGIALYLATADWPALPAGTYVTASGVVGERHGEVTLTLGSAADLVVLGAGFRPQPLWAATGLACEAFESRLIAVQAWVTSATTVDDGTGPINFIVPSGVVVAAADLAPGNLVELVGVLSQVDQTADGFGYYALLVTDPGDVLVLSRPSTFTPTPTVTASPTPILTLTPSPTATPTPTPTPSPTPTPTPWPISIADARSDPIGAHVLVDGVVTAPAGAILGDSVISIQDGSAGIYVRLPPGAPTVELGQLLEVGGVLAAPYGNLEMRLSSASEMRVLGNGAVPTPRAVSAADLGEATEGLLARISVNVDSVEAGSSGSLTLLVHDASGASRIFFHAPLGAVAADFKAGQQLDAVGLVGDRLGLYRLWPRNLSDVAVVTQPPTPTPKPTATPRQTASPTLGPTPSPTSSAVPALSIADALRHQGATVSITGVVTTRPGLLDADAQRVAVQDATAAVLVRLPAGFTTQPGRRLAVTGLIGTYYGAPQMTATLAVDKGAALTDATQVNSAPLSAGLEWRLVTVSGTIESVHKDGDAWRAELTLSGGGIPIVGLERSGIPPTAMQAGRSATITGIVKRAYPTASDQRLQIVPRSAADIRLGAAEASGQPGRPTSRPGSTPHPVVTPRPGTSGRPDAQSDPGTVLVGGVVARIEGAIVVLTAASGDSTVELVGDAAPLAATLRTGDLVNATGKRAPSGHVIVTDPADLIRVGAAGATSTAPSPGLTDHVPQSNPFATQTENEPQTGPLVVFAAILGLSALLVVGAFAWKLGWLNRSRNWGNWLKKRLTRI